MSEENIMLNQESLSNERVVAHNNIPYFMLQDDLQSFNWKNFNSEMDKILRLYEAYDKGCEFNPEGSNNDYIPSDLRFKKASTLLNKEARFLFSNPPSLNVNVNDVDKEYKKENAIIQDFIDEVLRRNNFNSELLKACKDCLIAKRIAIVVNFNEELGISITFLNSTEFIYKFSDYNGELENFICYYPINDDDSKDKQKWFKKTYRKENNKVYLLEEIYDGLGELIEEVTPESEIKLPFIPAVVILNDGLTGDKKGKSELDFLVDYESYYSKLSNADIDSQRKGMNPIKYTIDASSSSTEGLSTAAGSYWDLQTDDSKAEVYAAQVGILETNMSYSPALKTTLDRIEDSMHSEIDVPNINGEQLKGVITSGKTLKALYWGLITRCNEKMLAWAPAIEFMARIIVEGSIVYPQIASKYSDESIPNIKFKLLVENNYALPEDVEEEKNLDMAEVASKLMSRKAYLKKWRNLNDKEADEELMQIKAEMDLFDNSMLNNYMYQNSPDDQEDEFDDSDNKINDETSKASQKASK